MQRNYKYNQRTLNEIGYARIVDAGPRNIAINSVYNRGIYCKTTQRRRSARVISTACASLSFVRLGGNVN